LHKGGAGRPDSTHVMSGVLHHARRPALRAGRRERDLVRVTGPDGTVPLPDGRSMTTGEVIRHYPARRVIVHAQLDGRRVVATFHLGRLRGYWPWLRSLRGTRTLSRTEVPGPALAFAGYCPASRAWLTIVDHVEAAEPWPPGAQDPQALRSAHVRLVAALARQHELGIIQQDPAWSSFVPRGGTLYSVDGGHVHAQPAPVGRGPSLANLRRLYATKPEFTPGDIHAGYEWYCEHRGWTPAQRESRMLLRRIQRSRRRHARLFARRDPHDGRRFHHERSGHWRRVIDRHCLPPANVAELADALDATPGSAPAGQLIASPAGVLRARRLSDISPAAARAAWARALTLRALRIPVEAPAALFIGDRSRGHWLVSLAQSPAPPSAGSAFSGWPAEQEWIAQIGEILGELERARMRLTDPAIDLFLRAENGAVLLYPERVSDWLPLWPGFAAHWHRCVQRLAGELARDVEHDREEVAALLHAAMRRVPVHIGQAPTAGPADVASSENAVNASADAPNRSERSAR